MKIHETLTDKQLDKTSEYYEKAQFEPTTPPTDFIEIKAIPTTPFTRYQIILADGTIKESSFLGGQIYPMNAKHYARRFKKVVKITNLKGQATWYNFGG